MRLDRTGALALCALLAGCAAPMAERAAVERAAPAAESAADATIAWDEWGVAHITARSDAAGSYAFGWAEAEGRPDQLLELLGQGRGRAAEYWGEDYFEGDALMWRMGIPQALDVLYAAQGPEYQARLDAFAAGINAYLAAHPEAGTAERRRALPVTARDVLGHTQRAINLFFMAGNELGQLRDIVGAAQQAAGGASAAIKSNEPADEPAGERGSNGWAIAPSRSESGDAMLLMNPHLPWDGVFTWFEAETTTPGLHSYGVGLLGQPFTSIMFNEHLGWTHTVNEQDAADIYELTLVDGGYSFGGGVRAFEDSSVTLKVRAADGSVAERQLALRRSDHGPVLGQAGGNAWALRVAGLADPEHAQTFAQYDAMARATNRTEWESAFSRLQLPMFNAVFADDSGEILYVSNGLFPVRPRGDAEFWDGAVDGSDPSLLWSEYQPYGRLLRVADPASGFVQNSNETGYTATIPAAVDPADFPADYIAPTMRTRPQHGLEMLLGDASISYDELIAYAHDTRLTMAEDVLDDLIAAARADGRPEAMRAAEVLAAWDRHSNADSRGAGMFTLWASAVGPLESSIRFDRPWRFAAPAEWPHGLADKDAAVEALLATVAKMDAAGVALNAPWGDFARIPDGAGGTLPSSLGIGSVGAFRVGFYTPDESGVGFDFGGGTSWVAAIDFGETPRARAILPYGNFATRPEGVQSQLPLLSRGEFRGVQFGGAAAPVMRESLDYSGE